MTPAQRAFLVWLLLALGVIAVLLLVAACDSAAATTGPTNGPVPSPSPQSAPRPPAP